MKDCKCEPVGYQEIATLLDVKDRTVHMWMWEEKLPPPDYPLVHGYPAWEKATIIRWAGDTGRARSDRVKRAYRKLTGEAPHAAAPGGRPPKVTT